MRLLSYDRDTGMVSMDSTLLKDIKIADFKRIHAFFRRIESLKTGNS
jgi:hypothetical protein